MFYDVDYARALTCFQQVNEVMKERAAKRENNLGKAFLNVSKEFQKYSFKFQLKESQENLARSLYNIGLAYTRLGDLENGIRYARDSYEMRQRLYEEKPNENLAQSLSNMGNVYFM